MSLTSFQTAPPRSVPYYNLFSSQVNTEFQHKGTKIQEEYPNLLCVICGFDSEWAVGA